MRPVAGVSGDGKLAIVMVKSEESEMTSIVCVLRVTDGSAQIAHGAVGPDAGQRERDGDIDVGREALDRLARAAGENRSGAVKIVHRDAVVTKRCAGEASGGLRVMILTLSTLPSATARTASRPSSAPVGTRIRAPVALARSTRCIWPSSCRPRAARRCGRGQWPAPQSMQTAPTGSHSRTISACLGEFGQRDEFRG